MNPRADLWRESESHLSLNTSDDYFFVLFQSVISTPQRNHYFTADNQEEKDDWIFKVNNACKVTVSLVLSTKVSVIDTQIVRSCQSEFETSEVIVFHEN